MSTISRNRREVSAGHYTLNATPPNMAEPLLIILKTDSVHIDGVRKNAKHATGARPRRIARGDIILIQVTVLSSKDPQPVIRYRMDFVRCYKDVEKESDRIWGRHWKYIVEGENLKTLRHPFDIRKIQVTNDISYGQGAIKYVYVRPEDAAVIRARGLLETA